MPQEVAALFDLQLHTAQDTLRLDVAGPLGREGGEAISAAVQAQTPPPKRLVLNFTRTSTISTAGLGGVLWAVRLVTKAGGRVSAYGLGDHFRKVFHIMGITQYVGLYLDEAAAMRGDGP